ncbi:Choline dehydrogenase [Phytophthora cinnamomi]|uniref:Choline dehydrogenase n=1 Tax=Phytophthora cinnamomi TaxID=4785 RepID=UPI0035598BCF|nr:Choline dehydrogenase [Phytophthora cinnamomi]
MSSSSVPTSAPGSWQKRAGRQRQQANSKLGSWFVSKFAGGKSKSKLLREHDEETAQNQRRRPVGTLSAVTNQQQANAARREELGRPKPVRQKSFLRQQLQEMKRQSAEALQLVQRRMDGQGVAEETEHDLEDKSSSSSSSSEDEEDGLRVVDDPDDVLRGSLSSNPAHSRCSSSRRSSTSSRRRSAAEEQQEREDEILAHETQRDEYSAEVNRRMSQATQLYAEAISALDYALHPERQPDMEPSPKPLLLGVKKGSANMPKSEWI